MHRVLEGKGIEKGMLITHNTHVHVHVRVHYRSYT